MPNQGTQFFGGILFKNRFLLFLFGILLLFNFKQTHAASLVIADFDNTIVETRAQFNGAFQTKFKIFLIEVRSNVLQKQPESPRVVEVTSAEFEAIQNHLGLGNRRPGTIGFKYTLSDGTVIEPANYMVRDPETFDYFFEGKKSKGSPRKNYLLADFMKAEAAVQKNPALTFKGPFWDRMVAILSHKKSAKEFGIISARGHTQAEWKEFFTYLQKKGYIKHLPNFDLIFGVSLPSYDQFVLNSDVPERKLAVIENLAITLGKIELNAYDERIHPEGHDKKGFFHSLEVAEDHPRTTELLEGLFRKLAQRKVYPIKFAIFHAGYPEEIAKTHRPQTSVFTFSGNARPATLLESIGEPPGMSEAQALEMIPSAIKRSTANCEGALTK